MKALAAFVLLLSCAPAKKSALSVVATFPDAVHCLAADGDLIIAAVYLPEAKKSVIYRVDLSDGGVTDIGLVPSPLGLAVAGSTIYSATTSPNLDQVDRTVRTSPIDSAESSTTVGHWVGLNTGLSARDSMVAWFGPSGIEGFVDSTPFSIEHAFGESIALVDGAIYWTSREGLKRAVPGESPVSLASAGASPATKRNVVAGSGAVFWTEGSTIHRLGTQGAGLDSSWTLPDSVQEIAVSGGNMFASTYKAIWVQSGNAPPRELTAASSTGVSVGPLLVQTSRGVVFSNENTLVLVDDGLL